jgi:hypothetical protein
MIGFDNAIDNPSPKVCCIFVQMVSLNIICSMAFISVSFISCRKMHHFNLLFIQVQTEVNCTRTEHRVGMQSSSTCVTNIKN